MAELAATVASFADHFTTRSSPSLARPATTSNSRPVRLINRQSFQRTPNAALEPTAYSVRLHVAVVEFPARAVMQKDIGDPRPPRQPPDTPNYPVEPSGPDKLPVDDPPGERRRSDDEPP
jgi:hypothetical protein